MKKFALFLLVCALLFSFVSCVRYHAEAEDVAVFYYEDRSKNTYVGQGLTEQSVFQETFLSETMVSGSWNAYAEIDDPGALPPSRTILIDDQAEFDAAFVKCPFDIDLETEMIVVYTLTFTNRRETKIKNISFSDGVLSLELTNKRAKWGAKDTCMPYQRYVVVKLDKLDVDEVKVDYKIR